jgi:predicted dehydrogenase
MNTLLTRTLAPRKLGGSLPIRRDVPSAAEAAWLPSKRIRQSATRIALIGCGNVAPFYLKTLRKYPQLELVGVMDRDEKRATSFSRYYSIFRYHCLAELLDDRKVKLVINLTNPRSHFEVTKACLLAGKHVYSEKPLAMSFSEAHELVNLAHEKGLSLSAAPSRLLGETAQTMWKALRQKMIGRVHLAYAEMDGGLGLIHQARYTKWINELGIPWPYKDEFEVGCTLEHGAYAISWLQAFFGPVETVTAFSSCQIADKAPDVPLLGANSPDFSVAVLKFVSGVVSRLTCSWIAPSNHSLRVFGDRGVLCTDDIWWPRCRVYIKPYLTIGSRTMLAPWKMRCPLVRPQPPSLRKRTSDLIHAVQPRALLRTLRARARHLRPRVDFCLGVAELDAAIKQRRSSRLSAEFCLHTTEVMLAIQNAFSTGTTYRLKTSFDPIDPMPWARP